MDHQQQYSLQCDYCKMFYSVQPSKPIIISPFSWSYNHFPHNNHPLADNLNILAPFPFVFFFKYCIYLFLERGEGREKDRKRNINRLSLACLWLGTWPIIQVCAPTGNRTSDLWRMIQRGWCPVLEDDAQPTESHQSGLLSSFVYLSLKPSALVK